MLKQIIVISLYNKWKYQKNDFKKHTDNNFSENELFTKLTRHCACGFSYDLRRDFLDYLVFFFWASTVINSIVLHFHILYKISVIMINNKLYKEIQNIKTLVLFC
jgi:hypothetical protein